MNQWVERLRQYVNEQALASRDVGEIGVLRRLFALAGGLCDPHQTLIQQPAAAVLSVVRGIVGHALDPVLVAGLDEQAIRDRMRDCTWRSPSASDGECTLFFQYDSEKLYCKACIGMGQDETSFGHAPSHNLWHVYDRRSLAHMRDQTCCWQSRALIEWTILARDVESSKYRIREELARRCLLVSLAVVPDLKTGRAQKLVSRTTADWTGCFRQIVAAKCRHSPPSEDVAKHEVALCRYLFQAAGGREDEEQQDFDLRQSVNTTLASLQSLFCIGLAGSTGPYQGFDRLKGLCHKSPVFTCPADFDRVVAQLSSSDEIGISLRRNGYPTNLVDSLALGTLGTAGQIRYVSAMPLGM